MKKFTFIRTIVLLLLVVLIKTKISAQTTTIFPLNPTVYAGKSFGFTARATGFCGNQRNYSWSATGSTTATASSSPDYDIENRSFTYNTPGTYTISVTINRIGGCGTESSTATTTVTVLPASSAPLVNMWAGTNGGADISNYSVGGGIYSYGPEFLFDPFPSSNSTTAAIARSPYPTPSTGYFYWLENTNSNNGNTTIYGCNGDGSGRTTIGSIDMNGASNNSLGFVRFAMDPLAQGWILAGDATTVYLAKFASSGLSAVTPTMVDADGVTLIGGSASTFQNGDLCIDADGNLYALANNSSTGVTHL